MNFDDEFEPKLGKIRHGGSKTGRRYLQRVLQAATLAGKSRSGKKFHGNRFGRGAGVGRVLSERDRYAAFRARRVIVKSRVIRLKGTGIKAAAQHLRYIQRDGVTRDGQAGQLYDAGNDHAESKDFLGRCDDDRHQFRIIVSAEDGAEYDDLKPVTRRLMQQMEEDLGTKLDWVAVDHFNTGHPHTHIVLRGKDDWGKDLVIARDYMAEGMRERAAEIVSLDLGPKSDREIEDRLRGEVEQERLTSLDRELIRRADEDGIVAPGAGTRDAFRQTLRTGRLQKLKRLGLAEELDSGRWQLTDGIETTLRRMGERGDIIKTLHRELSAAGLARATSDYAIFDAGEPGAKPLIGRLAARGLSDELNDRHYAIVDGLDGRAHYVELGEARDDVPVGSIVQIRGREAAPREVDRTVARIAEQNGGRYSEELHRQADLSASREFVQAHVRRLEAMRRLMGAAEREADGSWKIASDHLARAATFERDQSGKALVTVELLSRASLQQQIGAEGATWLDRTLAGGRDAEIRDTGFGHETRAALSRRRQWLIGEGFAEATNDRTSYRSDMLAALTRRELRKAGGDIARETGLTYAEAGGKIEGIYRRSIELTSGKYAMIEKSREFTLVPWRPVLERYAGKVVAGLKRGDSISWSPGRQRGPGIS
ncbi:MAG TPA: relaxase/mobilization nuclease RlxS [Rhizomicrobium sp.]|jgi:type IV secretory pathway VirD2 relaxase